MRMLWLSLILVLPCCLAYSLDYSNKNIDFQMKQNGKDVHRELDDIWELYKYTHKKIYTTEENQFRRSLWEKNVAVIQKHNLEYNLGVHTYRMGINQLTDWTTAEYEQLLGFRGEDPSESPEFVPTYNRTNPSLPKEVDWRNEGYVTPVKNQGHCGSCWAFSSTGSLEGQHFAKTGKLVSLSEQNLVDCVKENHGCHGGRLGPTFEYIKQNNGIDTERSYSYKAKEGTCHYVPSDKGATDTGYFRVEKGSEDALKETVAIMGPISVGIDAHHKSFHLYESGIYKEKDCSSTHTSHAVLVVGYGTEDGQDYWLVKNSWGTSWGIDGYIKMARNEKNMCGIASFAIYPTV